MIVRTLSLKHYEGDVKPPIEVGCGSHQIFQTGVQGENGAMEDRGSNEAGPARISKQIGQ